MRLDGTAILGCNNDMQRRGVWCYEKAVSCFCAVTLLEMDENLRGFHLNLNEAARQELDCGQKCHKRKGNMRMLKFQKGNERAYMQWHRPIVTTA